MALGSAKLASRWEKKRKGSTGMTKDSVSPQGWRRGVALAVDLVVVWTLWLVAAQTLSLFLAFTGVADGDTPIIDVVVQATYFLAGVGSAVAYVLWVRRRGASVGSQVMGLSVGRATPLPGAVTESAEGKAAQPFDVAAAASVSWGRRGASWSLDALFVLLLCIPGGAVLFFPLFGLGMNMAQDQGMGALGIGVFVWFAGTIVSVTALYHVWGDATGGTWGKQRLGLVVLATDGTHLGWRRSVVRQAVKFALLGSVLGAVLMVATDNRRGWHDQAAGAVVVPASHG